jgi:UDP-N-acetylmuramate dehydrogenase
MPAEEPVVITDAPLRDLNTFGIDSRARRLVRLDDAAQAAGALALLHQASESDDARGQAPLVLGGGSNLLITQQVLERPVLHVRLRGARLLAGRKASGEDPASDTRDGAGANAGGTVLVEAAAGEPWDPFVRWTLAQGLAGLENLALIPGTVGAAPIQNIGAYGVEVREHVESLDAIHVVTGERRRFDAVACEFGYRDSVFKRDAGRDWLILAVRFRLRRIDGSRPEGGLRLDYGELRTELSARGAASPTATEVADAVAAIRRRKLPDPATLGNAGSFFKNPVVPADVADALQAREPGLPAWPADGGTKLAAAWLIERCGWKGHRRGDAGVHAHHALVLVNHGQARGAEILALARDIQRSVHERFGVQLDPEPVIV